MTADLNIYVRDSAQAAEGLHPVFSGEMSGFCASFQAELVWDREWPPHWSAQHLQQPDTEL